MQNRLKTLIHETLVNHEVIKFELNYVHKGCIFTLEIGDKRNEECGAIFHELEGVLSYGEFMDYLISHNVFHNFSGELFRENTELFVQITLIGSCWEFDEDPNIKYLYLSKEFITDNLNIDFDEIGMLDFDNENFSLRFHKIKDMPIDRLELYYFIGEWKKFNLNDKQYKSLKDYVDSIIVSSIPIYDVDFNHEVIWEVNCDDWCLDFTYYSTPIKLKLNDILA